MRGDIEASFSFSEDGIPIEEGFRDGNDQPGDGIRTVFPIISSHSADPWKPIGTGFFISTNGLFATAKHVVVGPDGQTPLTDLVGVIIDQTNRTVRLGDIIKLRVHPRADVAVGFLVDRQAAASGLATATKCLALTREIPSIGTAVVTLAFPSPQRCLTDSEIILAYQISPISGTVEDYFPDGRDSVLLPARCFQTNLINAGGASGGPVACETVPTRAQVFGINSTGLGGEGVSFASSILDILDLALPDIFLPSGEIRREITIGELATLGLVNFKG